MTDYTKNSFDYNYAEYETLIDYDDEIFPREGSTNETNIMVSTYYLFLRWDFAYMSKYNTFHKIIYVVIHPMVLLVPQF